MPTLSILVATRASGLFNVTGGIVHQELAGRSVRIWGPMDGEECSRSSTDIRFAGDPSMASGPR